MLTMRGVFLALLYDMQVSAALWGGAIVLCLYAVGRQYVFGSGTPPRPRYFEHLVLSQGKGLPKEGGPTRDARRVDGQMPLLPAVVTRVTRARLE